MVKRRKIFWFGHFSWHIIEKKSYIKAPWRATEDGRPKKNWLDNIKEWTNPSLRALIRTVEDRPGRWRLSVEMSVVSHDRSSQEI